MSAALAIVLATICLAGGGLLGFLLGRGGGGDKKRAEALEQEFEDYKRNVTEHFGKTAEHFQSMGRQYRELYEHMAGGASTLCESDDRTRLAFPSLLTIEAVAETPDEAEPALDSAPAEADAEPGSGAADAEDAQTRDEDSTRVAAEAADDDAAPAETTHEQTGPDDTVADADDADSAESGDDKTPAARVAASDDAESESELKVEVQVEVVDEGETGTEGAAVGATPLADSTDLDPLDDAGATRH